VTTVQKPTRIVAKKGMKQVETVTSAEIGCSVTMAVAVTASGNSILPFFVFPQNTVGITSLQGDQAAVLDLQTSQGG